MTAEDLILELRAVADRLWLISDRLQNNTQPATTSTTTPGPATEAMKIRTRVSTRPGGELSKPRTKPETMAEWMAKTEKQLGFKAG